MNNGILEKTENRAAGSLLMLITLIIIASFTFVYNTIVKEDVNYENTLASTIIIMKKDGKSYGTAFFINENTLITNKHVMSDNKNEFYAFINGVEKRYKVTHSINHPKNDLSIIKINGYKSKSFIKLCENENISLGQDIYSIGNTFMRLKEGYINSLVFRNGLNFTNLDIIGGDSGSALMSADKDCSVGVIHGAASEYDLNTFVSVSYVKELIKMEKK